MLNGDDNALMPYLKELLCHFGTDFNFHEVYYNIFVVKGKSMELCRLTFAKFVLMLNENRLELLNNMDLIFDILRAAVKAGPKFDTEPEFIDEC